MLNLEFFSSIHAQLGLMTWPLTLLSVLMMMLIIERLIFVALNSKTNSRNLQRELDQLSLKDDSQLEQYVAAHQHDKNTLSQGLCMLIGHREFTKSLREEAVSIWLQKKRRQFTSGLKLLNIIGVLSPLIGLLGTVLGLIEMFKGLSSTQGAISPAELADGLGLAMATTAAGLLIALPAIASSQLFSLWADKTLAKIEYILNHFNLHLAGVSFNDNGICPVQTCTTPCASQHTTEATKHCQTHSANDAPRFNPTENVA
ncbi:MotA/TolQ/ExbB proton channel family protein [Photobacterium aphoticum]|uniref:MotA/TolQ/ExbB proton channel family protein n=1 Tax=Photobacterium aphoticum TaxID=754436 RepID=UPI0009E56942|nr:MotA/TolQ/ExbB proton channel family protein [Photobacterium aphoticum]PSU59227.1 MotA/TolQ/ExbB proton channel family protein [Photobacterium aphoticum]GHA31142.1 biopolymer transport protein exbB1 [Photobacterium aphoticum]